MLTMMDSDYIASCIAARPKNGHIDFLAEYPSMQLAHRGGDIANHAGVMKIEMICRSCSANLLHETAAAWCVKLPQELTYYPSRVFLSLIACSRCRAASLVRLDDVDIDPDYAVDLKWQRYLGFRLGTPPRVTLSEMEALATTNAVLRAALAEMEGECGIAVPPPPVRSISVRYTSPTIEYGSGGSRKSGHGLPWAIQGPLLRFSSLVQASFPCYALGFRILDNLGDPWTTRFSDFKFQSGVSHERAIVGGCAVLATAVQGIALKPPVVVVSAIPSHATRLEDRHPLARVGRAVASSRNWAWRPDILSKRVHESRHSMKGSALVRDAVVEGAYQAGMVKASTVVILDDFATRGATINDVARAIRQSLKGVDVVGLVLGKNERVKYAGNAVNNLHIPAVYEQVWLRGA